MYPISQALQDHELIVLRVIGEWWEQDLTGSNKAASVKLLADVLPRLDMTQELRYLPPEEAAALEALIAAGGRQSTATFSRKFGDVRMMGPAALEREEPWFDPVSPAEALWYRGFLYKGFADEGDGMVEVFYLPDELMAQFATTAAPAAPPSPAPIAEKAQTPSAPPKSNSKKGVPAKPAKAVKPAAEQSIPKRPLLQPAAPPESAPQAATTAAVDDMTTLLSMAQVGKLQEGAAEAIQPYLLDSDLDRLGMLKTLAVEMGLLRASGRSYKPARTAVSWLQEGREAQLRALAEAWSGSAWNELRHVPSLVCEGSGWSNDPIAARTALLDALTLTQEWFNIADLIAFIHKENADFQRPNGNYDTWYIREVATQAYIRGFENWELVEGRLLRYLVQRPLVWLGLAETDGSLFRLTQRAVSWLKDEVVVEKDVPAPLVVHSDASLEVPLDTDRYQRFQAARIALMLPVAVGRPYIYRLAPHTLAEAQQQKIDPKRVLQFLEKASGRPIPATTKRALERWAEQGTEAKVEGVIVLRVRDAQILQTLREQPKTRPLIGESLGETAAIVQASDWVELASAAAQLGLLLDIPR